MLTYWDWTVIIFYLVFMMSIGFVWSKMNKNSSDYFRGGGNMLWWLAGMSSIAAGLTAYSFTAAGAKVFETGFFLFVVYLTGVPAYLLIYFFLAARYRQMRAVTVCDAIRRRYGRPTEQFWVWTALPLGLFGGGMMLYIVSLFVSAAVGMPIIPVIIVLAIAVTVMAGSGGSWAVAASDFIQMLIIIVVSVTVMMRALFLPELGGVSGFMQKIPPCFTNFSLFERPAVWIPMLLMFAFVSAVRAADLNTQGAKYLTVKDGDHAKKATLMMIIGSVTVPLIAFIPVMIGAALKFNLPEMFPLLKNANEGAYLAIAQKVLPQGMIGLMICAIFAATMSSMDTALNKNAGFFVKNFYAEFLRPGASEKEQLFVGKLFSFIFGGIVLLIAILIAQFRDADLFSLLLKLNVLLGYPLVIPMVLGIIYRKTPGWSAWSTVIVSMVVAYCVQNLIEPETFARLAGIQMPLSALEAKDVGFVSSGIITLVLGSGWYFFTALFYKQTTTEKYREDVKSFFKDMDTPIDHAKEHNGNQDKDQYRLMGILCMIYGGIMALGCLIPNAFADRMVFIWCGGSIFVIGAILLSVYQRAQRKSKMAEAEPELENPVLEEAVK
jgi:Na+/proline symporter